MTFRNATVSMPAKPSVRWTPDGASNGEETLIGPDTSKQEDVQ